jgi:hypothetical protein
VPQPFGRVNQAFLAKTYPFGVVNYSIVPVLVPLIGRILGLF